MPCGCPQASESRSEAASLSQALALAEAELAARLAETTAAWKQRTEEAELGLAESRRDVDDMDKQLYAVQQELDEVKGRLGAAVRDAKESSARAGE